jgi:hypothetical protein
MEFQRLGGEIVLKLGQGFNEAMKLAKRSETQGESLILKTTLHNVFTAVFKQDLCLRMKDAVGEVCVRRKMRDEAWKIKGSFLY